MKKFITKTYSGVLTTAAVATMLMASMNVANANTAMSALYKSGYQNVKMRTHSQSSNYLAQACRRGFKYNILISKSGDILKKSQHGRCAHSGGSM